jgi:signal transduction histidine kinase
VEWLTRHRPARKDALAAAAFAVLWFGAIRAGVHFGWWYPSPRWSWKMAGVFTTGVLLAREVWPRATFWLATVVFAAGYVYLGRYRVQTSTLISEFHLLPVVLAAYTVTARGRLKTWVVLLVAWGATGFLFLGEEGLGRILTGWDWRQIDVSGLAVLEVAVAAIVLAGRAVYRQETASRSARRRNELLRKAETEQVVTAERTRIARELHDLVAHHISAVVIRARPPTGSPTPGPTNCARPCAGSPPTARRRWPRCGTSSGCCGPPRRVPS